MEKNNGAGFTLIELLVVIAIIAVLASLSITQYLKYQRKAKIVSYAQPLGRGCLIDIVSFCITNQGEAINLTSLLNCRYTTIQTEAGNVTLDISISGNCTAQGNPPTGFINASLEGVPDYFSSCYFQGGPSNRTIRCTVKSR